MAPNEYQAAAIKTNIYQDVRECALGFASEAGEVAGKISKVYRDEDGAFTKSKRKEIAKELGDCCWFIATLCVGFGFTLESVMEYNIAKLADRAKRGVIGGSGDHR